MKFKIIISLILGTVFFQSITTLEGQAADSERQGIKRKHSDEDQDKGKGKDKEGGPSSSTPQELPNKAQRTEQPQGISVTYYNVGQGNCVLVQNHDIQQALLLDCGSIEKYNATRESNSKPVIEISNIISDIRKKIKGMPISVIVTHLDMDHYNLIPVILTKEREGDGEESAYLLKNIILSVGKLDLRKAKGQLGEFVDWLKSVNPKFDPSEDEEGFTTTEVEDEKKVHITLMRETDLEAFEKVLKPLNKEKTWITPLAEAVGSSMDLNRYKNADSAILRIGYDDTGSPCSALLPGDANKATTDYVIENFAPELLKSTILMSSHHGAQLEHSNDEEWIKATSPQAITISAGHQQGIGHPRCEIINRYLSLADRLNRKSEEHRLTCSVTQFIDAQTGDFVENPDKRKVPTEYKGTEAIFNTFDLGTIEAHFFKDSFTIMSRGDLSRNVGSILIDSQQCLYPKEEK